MADIKVKDTKNKTIKTIDKGIIATERFKDTIVHKGDRSRRFQAGRRGNSCGQLFAGSVRQGLPPGVAM